MKPVHCHAENELYDFLGSQPHLSTRNGRLGDTSDPKKARNDANAGFCVDVGAASCDIRDEEASHVRFI